MAQIAARTLGVDLQKVTVKPSNSLTAPNSWVTGGSVGSDTCGYVSQITLLRSINDILLCTGRKNGM